MGKSRQTQIDISIIIVSFNTCTLLSATLESVFASELKRGTYEVIVVDNGSTDPSVAMVRREYPSVPVIETGQNLGFARANNIAMQKSRGRYILLLNSDTEVGRTSISAMVKFMDSHPGAGAATCKLVLPGGSIDPACHRGFPTPWAALTYLTGLEKLFPTSPYFSRYHLGCRQSQMPHQVECISGAFFLVRKEVIDTVGMLDESFFMYAEDIDWSYRIKNAGWEIWYNPAVSTLHKKKQSGRNHFSRKKRITTELMFHENNRKFFRKYYTPAYPVPVVFLVEAFYWLRIGFLKVFHI